MAQSFETLDVIASQALGSETVEEVAAEISISRGLSQQMIEDHQRRMPHRHQGSLPTPPSHQSPVLGGQKGVLTVTRSPGWLHRVRLSQRLPGVMRRFCRFPALY